MPIWLVWALRDLRGGVRGIGIFLLCLALGVGAIGGVNGLNQAIVSGLAANGRALIGGDIEIRQAAVALDDQQWAKIHELAAQVSHSVVLRAMAIPPKAGADRRVMVELKTLDQPYPLVGQLELEPNQNLTQALAPKDGKPAILLDPVLLPRLGLAIGDDLKLGKTLFKISGTIVHEPDKNTNSFAIAPRAMIAADHLSATGLADVGSVLTHHVRIVTREGDNPAQIADALKQSFPEAGWYIRDLRNADPALSRFLERFSVYLTLVALAALTIGGIGVGAAVRHHLDTKTSTIATLKCLGASASQIFALYLSQVMLVASVGVALGLILSVSVPYLVPMMAGDDLARMAQGGFYPASLVLAAIYGMLIALLFALWPLGRAREIPAASLFRDIVNPGRTWPGWPYFAGLATILGLLVGLTLWTSDQAPFARQAMGGIVLALAAYWLVGHFIILAAKAVGRPRRPLLRMALSNLTRPGAPTLSVTLSMGAGLTVLVAVAQLEASLQREVARDIPDKAPAFLFLDIKSEQGPLISQSIGKLAPDARFVTAPAVAGRILKVKDVPIEQVVVDPKGEWLQRREFTMSWQKTLTPEQKILSGDNWVPEYRGPPLVSFSKRHADYLGLKIGDKITFSILGRPIEAIVANLRDIDWVSGGISFLAIFGPGVIDKAPLMQAGAVFVEPDKRELLFSTIAADFPNVTAVRIQDVLNTVAELIGRIANAVRATAALTLAAGLLVLAGAVAAGHRRRVYDSVVMKVLGANRRMILSAYLIEFALMGLAVAGFAVVLGAFGAGLIVEFVMQSDYTFEPVTAFASAVLGIVVVMAFGLFGTWRALSVKPMGVLRSAAG